MEKTLNFTACLAFPPVFTSVEGKEKTSNFVVALIIDSLAENIFLKRGWFLFYLEGFMVGLGRFFVVAVGFCFFFFSHLPPF